jgi:hypothetical protein
MIALAALAVALWLQGSGYPSLREWFARRAGIKGTGMLHGVPVNRRG